MPLEDPIIDDVRYRDLVTMARRDMPTVSGGRWTHHGPADAGVTIAELHAWLAEQQVFTYDHLTPDHRRALLALAGVHPQPARCARTVMQICVDETGFAVAAGAALDRPDVATPMRYTVVDGLSVVPLARIGLMVGGRDRAVDLDVGRPVAPLPAQGRGQFEIWLWCSAPLRAAFGQKAGLLCMVDPPGGIAPGWAPRPPDDAIVERERAWPGPMLAATWSYETRQGFRTFAADDVEDGTDGFRRSGVVRFAIPADFSPMDARAAGPWPYRLRITASVPDGVTTPVLRSLAFNVVEAEHRWAGTHVATRHRLPLPGETLALPTAGAPLLGERLVASLVERDGRAQIWRPTDSLGQHGPADRVFTFDREQGLLSFGDGRTGRQPTAPPEGGRAVVRYQMGGGLEGNVAAGSAWYGREASGVRALNLVAGVGGAEPESIEAAERRASALLERPERALTTGDIEHLARTTPGLAIARARAVVGHDPHRPGVTGAPGLTTVFVVPAAHRDPAGAVDPRPWIVGPRPDGRALAAIATRLTARRPAGIEIRVRPPCYRPVRIRCLAAGDASERAALFASLTEAIRRFLDPLVGGEVGTGWPFGGPLVPSSLLGVARKAAGERATITGVQIALGGVDTRWEDCEPVALAAHELPLFDGLQLRLSDRPGRMGGLR